VLADLRESGSLEQDADVVMFIHREEVAKQGAVDPALKGMADLIVAKHRAGALDNIKLVFQGEHTLFRNAARGVGQRVDES
jgi:replicative DNA helicase